MHVTYNTQYIQRETHMRKPEREVSGASLKLPHPRIT